MTGLVKHDKDKPRYGLIPVQALKQVARAFTHGAKKYSDWNWLKGTNWERYYSASRRHSEAFWDREDKDSDSGLHHLALAICCLLILLTYDLRGIGKDDRPSL